MSFTPTIKTYDSNAHLSWEGRLLSMPGIFTGQHHFKLHERKSGTTFEQSKDFSGVLAMVLHWVGSAMYRNTESGFKLMNETLKKRVEGISATDHVPGEGMETRVFGE